MDHEDHGGAGDAPGHRASADLDVQRQGPGDHGQRGRLARLGDARLRDRERGLLASTGEPQVRDLGFVIGFDDGRWVEVKRAHAYTVGTPRPYVPWRTSSTREAVTGWSWRSCRPLRDALLVGWRLQGGGRLHVLLAPHLGSSGWDNTAWVAASCSPAVATTTSAWPATTASPGQRRLRRRLRRLAGFRPQRQDGLDRSRARPRQRRADRGTRRQPGCWRWRSRTRSRALACWRSPPSPRTCRASAARSSAVGAAGARRCASPMPRRSSPAKPSSRRPS